MSINSDLQKLRRTHAGVDTLNDYYAQIDAENNDRGAAILASTFLESGLTFAVSRRLPNSASLYASLFENDGILSSFHSKSMLADALNIYGDTTRHNINIVKNVRNTFAHSYLPIVFSQQEITRACDALTLPSSNPQRYREKLPFSSPREKFTTICEVTGVALLNYAAACVNMRSDLISQMVTGKMIPVTPEPLP